MLDFIDIDELATPLEPVKQFNDPSLGTILSNIESQLPNGHPYKDNDRITWGHETTHGINSRIRNTLAGPKQNGIYILNNQAVLLPEPPITLRDVAGVVPRDLRGQVYDLYLVRQQSKTKRLGVHFIYKDSYEHLSRNPDISALLRRTIQGWNDRPLYVYDEWSGYLNGSIIRNELNIKDRAETVQYALEFVGYAWSLIEAADYPANLKRFTKWQTEQTIQTFYASTNLTKSAVSWYSKIISNSYWKRFEDYAGYTWVEKWLRGKVTI